MKLLTMLQSVASPSKVQVFSSPPLSNILCHYKIKGQVMLNLQSLSDYDGMVMLRECKPSKCQNKLQQLQWKEQEKMERPHKRWWDEVREDSNKMGIKDRQAMVRDHWEWRKIVLLLRSMRDSSA